MSPSTPEHAAQPLSIAHAARHPSVGDCKDPTGSIVYGEAAVEHIPAKKDVNPQRAERLFDDGVVAEDQIGAWILRWVRNGVKGAILGLFAKTGRS